MKALSRVGMVAAWLAVATWGLVGGTALLVSGRASLVVFGSGGDEAG